VRGPFRPHVGARWGHDDAQLVDAALAAADDDLLDYVASRAALRVGDKRQTKVAATLSRHYEMLRDDPQRFAARAAAVLTQVPAYSVWNYGQLVRENRLARLLFERTPAGILADARAVRDLLEAPEIHVQALALRALGQDDPRAGAIAARCLDLLLPTLLRPLHRRTRRLAFGALDAACRGEPEARAVVARAREALDLPDRRYDKEGLVQLLGRLLARHPSLRRPGEAPSIFRRAAGA
jgi:hypothetical protein